MYITGSENIVADALSHIYSNDADGTEQTKDEYTYFDVTDDDSTSGTGDAGVEVLPVLAGIEARIVTRHSSRTRQPTEKATWAASEVASAVTLPSATKEASKNVMARLKGRFALKEPRSPDKATEGENIDKDNDRDRATTAMSNNTTAVSKTQKSTGNTVEGTLLDIVSQSLQGLDLPAELRGKYKQDTMFKPIIARPNEFRNFEVDGQLIYLRKADARLLCIHKVLIQGRSVREIIIAEAHSMLAHLGANKTLE